MDRLPQTLKNLEQLIELYKDFYTKKLREAIFLNIIKDDETDYFDIDDWIRSSRFNTKKVLIKTILEPILNEITNLNWYYTFSYGNTVLFIHQNEKPPTNCYNNEFL